jgi:hypothetical protein
MYIVGTPVPTIKLRECDMCGIHNIPLLAERGCCLMSLSYKHSAPRGANQSGLFYQLKAKVKRQKVKVKKEGRFFTFTFCLFTFAFLPLSSYFAREPLKGRGATFGISMLMVPSIWSLAILPVTFPLTDWP